MFTLHAKFGNIVGRMAKQISLDVAPLLGSNAQLNSDRLAAAAFDRAILSIIHLAPGPAYGLRAAENWHPADFGALGFAWLASRSLRLVLLRTVRFSRLMGDRARFRLDETNDSIRLSYKTSHAIATVDHFLVDMCFSILLSLCRINTGKPIAPSRVGLARPRPEEPSPYWRFFGCPVDFDSEDSWMQFPIGLIDAPLPSANRALAETLDTILIRELAQLDKEDIIARTKAALLDTLMDGSPDEAIIAQTLLMSKRTLQRRLAEQGTHFQNVVDETRCALAKGYLADTGRSITEIAFMTGFATPSAFSRAFSRWTGQSPSSWRTEQGIHSPGEETPRPLAH